MTLEEIKTTVDEGKIVYHQSTSYQVTKDGIGQYFIECMLNDYCIGLTWLDGVTMNGKEEDFYIN